MLSVSLRIELLRIIYQQEKSLAVKSVPAYKMQNIAIKKSKIKNVKKGSFSIGISELVGKIRSLHLIEFRIRSGKWKMYI